MNNLSTHKEKIPSRALRDLKQNGQFTYKAKEVFLLANLYNFQTATKMRN